jgi:XTP/dITP diphosphohydrolase
LNRRLLLATSNPGKKREIHQFLRDLPLDIFSLSDIDPPGYFPEDGQTFMANAEGKSHYYSDIWKDLILGEDSGLAVDALNGDPGVFSARFSGEKAADSDNIKKVLTLMKEIPREKRTASFISSMVLSCNGKTLLHIEENVQGFITREKKGGMGFGYDPIFYYPPMKKTFAQMSRSAKNKVSHRGKALEKLRFFLTDYLA